MHSRIGIHAAHVHPMRSLAVEIGARRDAGLTADLARLLLRGPDLRTALPAAAQHLRRLVHTGAPDSVDDVQPKRASSSWPPGPLNRIMRMSWTATGTVVPQAPRSSRTAMAPSRISRPSRVVRPIW